LSSVAIPGSTSIVARCTFPPNCIVIGGRRRYRCGIQWRVNLSELGRSDGFEGETRKSGPLRWKVILKLGDWRHEIRS
jgi:hypothetical protein